MSHFLSLFPTPKHSRQGKPAKMANNSGVAPFQSKANSADSRLDSLSALDIDSEPLFHRQSGIVCTIGKPI